MLEPLREDVRRHLDKRGPIPVDELSLHEATDNLVAFFSILVEADRKMTAKAQKTAQNAPCDFDDPGIAYLLS